MKYLLFIVVLALVATISSAQPKLRGNVEDRFLAEMEESDSTTGMENKEGDSVAMSEEEAYARHLEELDAYDRYLGEDDENNQGEQRHLQVSLPCFQALFHFHLHMTQDLSFFFSFLCC